MLRYMYEHVSKLYFGVFEGLLVSTSICNFNVRILVGCGERKVYKKQNHL